MLSPEMLKTKFLRLLSSKTVSSDAVRFVLGGVANTLVTLMVYEVALLFFQYRVAYSISWLAGILIAVSVYPSKVFVGSNQSLTAKISIAIIYVLVFLSGLVVIDYLVDIGIPSNLSIFGVLIFTTLLNFVLLRLLLRAILKS